MHCQHISNHGYGLFIGCLEVMEGADKSGECDMDTTQATVRLPQKRYYRQRAHSNPISDHIVN